MGRSSFRRGIGLVAAACLSLIGPGLPADATGYGAASTAQIVDPAGDGLAFGPIPVHEPRADLTGAGAVVLTDGRLKLTATVAEPADPATDPAWADGRSGLMWIVDTNGDATGDYLVAVGMAPQLTAVVGPYFGQNSEPVGCDPVPEYSAGRYSVTLVASCLSLPPTFGWAVLMWRDTDQAADTPEATDIMPNPDDLLAGPGTVTDPTGDVTARTSAPDPRVDITAASAAYEGGRITLSALLATPTDPRVEPDWASEWSGLGWELDTDGDARGDFVVTLTGPDLAARVTRLSDFVDRCTGSGTYAPPRYSVSFDASCVDSPARFMWNVFMSLHYNDIDAGDTAPEGGMVGPVTALLSTSSHPQLRPSGQHPGYWMITEGGEVHAFGGAAELGDDNGSGSGASRVDIEPTATGRGYWILARTGAVTARGDARVLGDAAALLRPGEHAAALSATPNGDGYWIFTSHGRVLAFGAADHFGDMGGVPLNGRVLDSVVTPTGRGYWMVASDGGIFSFGDATFHGSMGGTPLNQPVMSMAADPDGKGYWLVASDGGIFAFEAPFHGSMGGVPLNKPVSGMVPGNAGYLMVAEDGGVFSFGNVTFHGSLGATPPPSAVVAVALVPANG